MNKKAYMKPEMWAHTMKMVNTICAGSGPVQNVGGNADLIYGGGGSGAARSRKGVWDDDDEDVE
jgi:hypothetical protein